jgi:hypothetical protein
MQGLGSACLPSLLHLFVSSRQVCAVRLGQEKSLAHLSLEVVVHSGHEVLIEIDNYILLIVDDPLGILDELLRPHPIHLLTIIIIFIYYFKLDIIKFL